MAKIRTHLQFVADVFKAETGLEAEKIFQIGFNQYMIEASDGNTYQLAS